MRKRKKFNARKPKKVEKKESLRELDRHDTEGYFRDLEYIGRLSFLSASTRDWIETTMFELRDKSNIYENLMGELLIKKNVNFIHQAPFVFRPRKIYFADFYLPTHRIVIEVDGTYHYSFDMQHKDSERDCNFKSIGVRVIRVSNEETKDPARLSMRLAEFINEFR